MTITCRQDRCAVSVRCLPIRGKCPAAEQPAVLFCPVLALPCRHRTFMSRFAKSSASSLSTGSRASSASFGLGVVAAYLAYRLTSRTPAWRVEIQLLGSRPNTSHRGCTGLPQQLFVDSACGAVDPQLGHLLQNSSGLRRRIYSALMALHASLRVEDGGGLGNALRRPDLPASSGRNLLLGVSPPRGLQPAGDIVQHCLGQVALPDHDSLHRRCAWTACSVRPSSPAGEWMRWGCPSQRPSDTSRLCLGWKDKILAAADDVGNAHQVVVLTLQSCRWASRRS